MATHRVVFAITMDEMDGTAMQSAELMQELIYHHIGGEADILDFWDSEELLEA